MSELMAEPSKEAREAISKFLDTLARRYSFFFKQDDEDLLWELMESFAAKARREEAKWWRERRIIVHLEPCTYHQDDSPHSDVCVCGFNARAKEQNERYAALEKAGK